MDQESSLDPRPYKRRVWVTVILSLLDPVLPFFYNGYLRRGIIIFLVMFVAYILLSLLPAFSFAGWIVYWAFYLIVYIGFLVYNIRQTRHANLIGKPRLNRVWVLIVSFIVLGGILGIFTDLTIERFVVKSYHMPSVAMEEALLVGDYLMAGKRINPESVSRGDLIIFKYPGDLKQNYIKRVVALPGDRIRIENKQVYINDMQEQPPPTVVHMDRAHCYASHEEGDFLPVKSGGKVWLNFGYRDNMPEKTVPPGMLFVLGDNRDNSADSRYWGFLDRKLNIGKPKYIYLSWDSDNNRIRWDRIGKRLD